MEKATFLKPDIEQKTFTQGLFVRVAHLENLPEEVKKLIPEGFVLKTYKFDTDKDMLFGDKDIPVVTQASILKERYETVKKYFVGIQQNLVVKTQFVIGRENQHGKLSFLYKISPSLGKIIDEHWHGRREKVFEIQENISDAVDYRDVDEVVLAKFDHITQKRILKDFETIVVGILNFHEEDPIFHDERILDVYGTRNLVLSGKGEWKLIDTNYWFRLDGDDRDIMCIGSMEGDLQRQLEKIRTALKITDKQ